MTHDRVLRFTSDFASSDAAQHYAIAQALDWISQSAGDPSPAIGLHVRKLLARTGDRRGILTH